MKPSCLLMLACCGVLVGAIKPPKFAARRDYPSAPGYVAVADVNGDGIPDVISVSGTGFHTLPGGGNGTFRVGPTTNPNNPNIGYSQFVAIDLNGDGIVDLVICDGIGGAFRVWFGVGDGSFQWPVSYGPSNFGYLAVGDFNGDNIPDVVIADGSGLWFLRGQGRRGV